MKYSILEIAEILGADASHLNNASIDTLLTDSRTLTYPDRSLFFALHTDSNDGSDDKPPWRSLHRLIKERDSRTCGLSSWWSTSRKACRQATPISLL